MINQRQYGYRLLVAILTKMALLTTTYLDKII